MNRSETGLSENSSGSEQTAADATSGEKSIGAIPTVIIGSGPAGLTAAIYAQRAGLRPLVIAGAYPNLPGGQLTTTSIVENFPGFPNGVSGSELVASMRTQAENLGVRILDDSAEFLTLQERPFRIRLEGTGKDLTAETIILAAGAIPRPLGVKGEQEYQSRGVSSCATCDGFLYRKKRVVVVGGGDTALEEAEYLSKLAASVTLVHRRGEFRASTAMTDRIRCNPRITAVMNAVLEEIKGDGKRVCGVVLRDVRDSRTWEISADGVFAAVGRIPQSALVRGQADLDSQGYIRVQPGTSITSVPGLFAAGDVCDPVYRQAIVAAASGCRAALDADRFLKQERSVHY